MPSRRTISRSPSRLSKCPRSSSTSSQRELLFASRSWRNSCGSADDRILFLAAAEQLVNIPVPRVVCCLQGFLPEQGSTALPVDHGESLQGYLPVQSSASSSQFPAGVADEAFVGVCRTFPRVKKSATLPPLSGSELPPPWTPPAFAVRMDGEEVMAQRRRRQETQQQASEALEMAQLLLDQASKRRKRKKRMRRVPKSSSHSSHRRARRRHLQWHIPVWFSSSCGMYKVDVIGLHLALYSFFLPSGQDARHLGRCGTEGQLLPV